MADKESKESLLPPMEGRDKITNITDDLIDKTFDYKDNKDKVSEILNNEFKKYSRIEIKAILSELSNRLKIGKMFHDPNQDTIKYLGNLVEIGGSLLNKIPLTEQEKVLEALALQAQTDGTLLERPEFKNFRDQISLVQEGILVIDSQNNYPIFNYNQNENCFYGKIPVKGSDINLKMKYKDFVKYLENVKAERTTILSLFKIS